MRWIVLIPVILALTLTPASAQVPPEGRNQIHTTGMGRVEVTPDQAILTVGTTLQRPTANEAWTATSKIAGQVLARIEQLGVRKDQIRTSGIQLFPVYGSPRDEGGQPKLVGYRASYTMTLTIDDLGLVGRAIDAAVEAGATNIQGVVFSLRDSSKARKDALTLAVRDAREKAEVIAQAAGLQLRGVERIVEGGVNIQPVFRTPPPPPLPGGAVQQAPTVVDPGTITVFAQVQTVFGY